VTIILKAQSKSGSSRRNVVLKKIEQKKTATGRAFNIANKAVANFLLDKSRAVVPIDEGDLHDSSRVNGVGRGFDNRQEVSYNQPYALMQHENLSYEHAPGKQAKYLTGPARQYNAEMKRLMKDTMRRYSAKGVKI
jgi:hypothetical protein